MDECERVRLHQPLHGVSPSLGPSSLYSRDVTATDLPAPSADDVQPVSNETLDRVLTGTITVIPFIALVVVGWQVWADLLFWSDLIVFAIMYVATGLGVT